MNFLLAHPQVSLTDVAFTLNAGRKPLPVRQSFVCSSREEAIALLSSGRAEDKPIYLAPAVSRSIVFLFPGQGKAYTGLGQDLHHHEPCFRQEVDRCCGRLAPLIGCDLRELLFAKQAQLPKEIYRPLFWQPALFVIEYALARLWMSWGIMPAAMIGHSLGEYVAAALAGVLGLEDALALVAERARGTEQLEAGAMLALPVSEERIRQYIKDRVSLAAVNAPELCVLAGPVAEIDRLERELASSGAIRLESSHAFHSPLVEPIMESLTRLASRIKLSAPRIPYLSNVTGTWIRDEEALDPGYWARHLRKPVRFGDCLQEAMRKPGRILLEVGPGKVLSDLARRSVPDSVALASLKSGVPDERALTATLGRLWTHGAEVQWTACYQGEKRRRISLPTYPFERQSYWVTAAENEVSSAPVLSLAAKDAPENWLYSSTWKRSSLPRGISLEESLATSQTWLVFAGETGVTPGLVHRLRAAGHRVTEVRQGAGFNNHGDGSFSLDPHNAREYGRLFDALRTTDGLPNKIIHEWSVDHANPANGDFDSLIGFTSLIYLAQVLGAPGTNDPVRLCVLTSNVHRILDEELSDAGIAAALGIIHVLPKENPRLVCQAIDLDSGESDDKGRLQDALLAEQVVEDPEEILALRHGHRWVPVIERIRLDAQPEAHHGQIRSGGVYLITHGFQELGLALAERLATRHNARAVLMDRAFFPQPEDWQGWIADQGEDDPVSRKIFRLAGIREHLRVISADLTNRARMARIKSELESDLGPIAGVFHLEKPSKTGLIQGKAAPVLSTLQADLSELKVLEELFADAGFLATFSSNLAESGGIGQVDQAARNAVVSHVAEDLARRGRRALAIELGTRGWHEAGEDNPDSQSFIYQQLEEKRQRFGMTTAECLDVAERALSLGLPGVIVSTRDFASLMEQQHLFTADFFQHEMEKSASRNGASSGGAHARPDISTPYEPPRNEVEKLLLEIWESAFRFEKIGVNDNFFELGGHSLLAVQVLKNMNETFSSRVTLKDLFDAPAIAQLAPLISGASVDGEDAEALEALLSEIEGMPEEELRAELESDPAQMRARTAND